MDEPSTSNAPADKTRVLFDWDDRNLRKLRKHKITREEVEEVFHNDPEEMEPQYDEESEELRERLVGHTFEDRPVFVIWTMRGDKVRVISAREATGRLLRAFEEWRKYG